MAEQTEEQKQAAIEAAAKKAASEKEAKEQKAEQDKLREQFASESKKPGRYIVNGNLVDPDGKVILPVVK